MSSIRPPLVLRIQIHHAKSPETRIDSALFGRRSSSDYALHSFVNGHRSEREQGRWFLATARSDGEFFDAGPASVQGKTLLQKANYALRYGFAKRAMLKRAPELQPDIVSSTQNKDLKFSKDIADSLKAAWLPHVIYPISPWLGQDALRILPDADYVIACSHFIEQNARDHGITRVATIYPAVQEMEAPADPLDARLRVRAEFDIPADSVVIGMAARLARWKGQRDVLKAFQQLAPDSPDLFLMLGGDGEDRGELEVMIARGPAAERVRMLGFRNDISRVFTAWDIAAHPSRKEAFGLATAEASLACLPVVVYDDGAAPEIIEDGHTGFVVPLFEDGSPEGGNTDGLARAFATLIEMPELRRKMGQAGQQRIREVFPADGHHAAPVYRDVVHELVASRTLAPIERAVPFDS